MLALLLTVPHTGTHLALDILHDADINILREKAVLERALRNETDAVVWRHTRHRQLTDIVRWLEKGAKPFAMMRNPWTAAASWKNRGRTMPVTGRVTRGTCPMDASFRYLRVFAKDALFLTFDTPDREERLAAWSEAFGRELKTDWKPRNASHRAPRTLDEHETRAVESLMSDPWFNQFGYAHGP